MTPRRLFVLVVDESGPRPLKAIIKEALELVIEHCEGNKSRVARVMGISRNTIYRCLKGNVKYRW